MQNQLFEQEGMFLKIEFPYTMKSMERPSHVNAPRRKRLKRYDTPDDARLLTFSCFKRRQFLSRPRTCQWFLEALEIARNRHGVNLWAYVIMPEHVHILVYPRDESVRISAFLYSLKKSVANRALEFVKSKSPEFLANMEDRQPNGMTSYRFWQRGGGYDQNLFNPIKIWEKIDYIHKNPVRRKLADSPEEWEWSSAHAFATREAKPIRIDFESLPDDHR